MNRAQHRCNVVELIHARRAKITADNSMFAPLVKDPDRQRELAEAAPFWTDENEPTPEAPAYSWPARDGYFRKADALPAIKPQAEIDDEAPVFSPVAYVVMFAAVVVVVAIITAFNWLVGAV